nr:zinc finger, CCHC-type [Tanacetum cinerariifolium]
MIRDANPIRTLRDYSKPSYEGYRNTIKLLVGNNVVPLRFDTIRLVQNGCSFYRLRSEDPNQHLKDFLKLVDLLNLDRRTAKLCNDILMFQQHQGESLSEAWTRFKDVLWKVPHHGLDLWLQVQIFYNYVDYTTQMAIDYAAGVIECKVGTLMEKVISLMGRSESIFGMSSNMMCQLPPERLQVEAFEDLVMNFILDQEEGVKQLEEYIGVTGSDFMQLSLKVVEKLKDEIRAEENIIEKIEKITRLYLMRRILQVLRKFHWMILGGRFNQLSHVSSLLLSKPWEY